MENNCEKAVRATILEIFITTKCTLRCKLCINGLPYAVGSRNIDSEFIKREMSSAFSLFDYADLFEFMGGEPMLHPELPELLREVFKYSDQIGCIRLITNGTLIPSKELLDVIRQNKAKCDLEFLLSDYGDLSVCSERLQSLLASEDIRLKVNKYNGDNQYFGGWVDLGRFEHCNLPEEDIISRFKKCACAIHGHRQIYDGKIFGCSRGIGGAIDGLLPPPDTLVDLFDDVPIEQKRERLLQYCDTPFHSCYYCKGFSEQNSVRFPAAEQLQVDL